MSNLIAQEWFEMAELRRRKFTSAVWIPLRACERHILEDGREEFFGAGCLGVYVEKRDMAARLGWMDIGISQNHRPYAFKDNRYKRAESYIGYEDQEIGVDLIFNQHIGYGHLNIWHINQDIILALGLIKENNSWIKPDEDYCEVIIEHIGLDGQYKKIEVRQDYLRDYLCARGLALKLVYYRQRLAKLDDISHINWPKEGKEEEAEGDRFSLRTFEIAKSGSLWGEGMAVFHAWRTDVDVEEDIPVFGPETDANTDGKSSYFKREGERIHRVEGELWREEWIEPGTQSTRVRGDKSDEDLLFIVDASGTKEKASVLDDEEIGRYLWFDPKIISALSQHRGGDLNWYTRNTGGIKCSHDWETHFGINKLGLINVYAYDVAKLPLWQQRIWAGFNVAPNGGVCAELQQAQMETRPARTEAPEQFLPKAISVLNTVCTKWTSEALFREHDASEGILKAIHRFRALEPDGLYALAKDLVRLIVERIDVRPLRKIASPPKGENWGSLKSLEKALATLVAPEEARERLEVLSLVYELRKVDAHLPSASDNGIVKLGLDKRESKVHQGEWLIGLTGTALLQIAQIIRRAAKHS